MIKVNPDKNMRAARRVDLEQQAKRLQDTICEQESASGKGDPAVVALRARKIAEHRAELYAINAELDAIRAAG